jgi:hypothetical protein
VQTILPRAVFAALMLVILATAGIADAAISPLWHELGGSASGEGVSQAVPPAAALDASVAVGSNGFPVVAYTEYPDAVSSQGAITVKRWTGSTWETLSGIAGIAQGYAPQVRIAASGAIHVAWLQDDLSGNTEIHLRVRTATTFDELGGSDSPGGISTSNPGITSPFSLALDGSGNPLVAFLGIVQNGVTELTETPALVDDTQQVYVRRWTGSAWAFVGSDFTGGGASNAVSFVSPTGTIQHDADTPTLTVNSDDHPVVAFSYYTIIDSEPTANTDVYVTRWNGSAWVAVGPAVPAGDTAAGNGGPGGVSNSDTGSFNPSIAAGPAGALALAWEEDTPTGATYVWVRVWNGTNWVELAGSASDSGFALPETMNVAPRIALDGARPVVAWQLRDSSAPSQVFVLRWNGANAWEELGLDSANNAGISDAAFDALTPALALGPDGTPAIAWIDSRELGGSQLFLRQLYSGPVVPLTVRVTGNGLVTSTPLGVQCAGGTCGTDFPSGTSVTLIADPAPFRRFTGWAGACTGTGPCIVAMTQAQSVNASFAGAVRLSVSVDTPTAAVGQGAVGTVSGPAGTCGADGAGDCTVDLPAGTRVSLQAAAEPGNKFLSWSGGPCNGRTNATCDVTLTTNASTVALFRGITGVRVTKAGNGIGTVSGIGFACGVDCFDEVFTGTSRALTAAPAIGSRFLGWSGDVCAAQASGPCTVLASGLNRSVTATFQLNRHRLAVAVTGSGFTTSNPAGIDCGGSHTPCTTDYDYNTLVRLTPAPEVDTMLASWTGCTSLNGSVCNVLMTANRAVTLRFAPARTLTVEASGNGTGRIVTATPPGLTCVSNCSESRQFALNASVVLTPQPAVGTRFQWVGGGCIGAAACTRVMSENRTVTGQFTLNRHALTVISRLTGRVENLPPLPNGTIDCGSGNAACSGVFDYGTSVVLRAVPNEGFVFVSWAGVTCPGGATNATCAFPLRANVTATPTFRARTLVTVVKPDNGSGTVTAPGISCGPDCSEAVFDGKAIALVATPAVGSRFLGFGGGCVSNTSSCPFVPTGNNRTVTAHFQLLPYTVTVTNRPNGEVTDLNGLPDPVLCGAGETDCTSRLDFGTPVVLRAVPIFGTRFVNWTGGFCNGSMNATCAFKLGAANVSLTPNYRNVTTLSLNKSGMGTVTSIPAGISCGLTCSSGVFDFARGTLVRLIATPLVGWSFNGFSGACVGAACTVNASAETALVGASFSIQSRRLRVTVVGNGSVSGAGFSCDGSTTPCAQDFDYGTSLLLTPVAAEGHRFTGWTESCIGANPATCRPLLTVNRSVTATFRPIFTLAVSKAGNSNSGAITSLPAGINCGVATMDCSEVYLGGTVVTLTRSAPIPGTLFRWLGDCAARGTNATCVLTMTSNRSVSGEYRLQPLGLTVNKIGAAFGTVTRVGGALNCGPDCFEVVNYGTPVTLRATPAAAAEFVAWTGCGPATNLSCSFPLTANRTVTATFRPLVTGLTLSALSDGPLSIGSLRPLTATALFSDGSQQNVTFLPTTTWAVAPAGVVTVSTTGLVTGLKVGNASVRATFRRGTQVVVSDPFPIQVATLAADTPTTRAIAVTCAPYGQPAAPATQLTCLPSAVNFEVHCRALGQFQNNGPYFDITDQVTWVTSNAAVARATGLVAFTGPVRQSFRIIGNGTAALSARLGTRSSLTTVTGPGTDPWVVQSSTQTLSSAPAIQPSTPTVAVDGQVQLAAIATFNATPTCASPPARDFSLLVDWASSNESVADVSFFGQATGLSEGSVTISATYGTMPPATVPLVVDTP